MSMFYLTGTRLLLVLLCSLVGLNSYASENIIQLSAEHINTLDIKLGKPDPVAQFPVLTAPAKVVIPPKHEYIVSATQAGYIEKQDVAVGDQVVSGQVLAQLNSPDLLTLQREYLKAGSALQLASAIYQREKKLLDEGIIPDRRWQETSTQYHSAVSDADERRQLLEIAGMTSNEVNLLGKTHKLTKYLYVRAPIDGVVIDRLVLVGAHVDMMVPLYRIANLNELWLEIAIPQERMTDIKIGDLVEVENSDIKATISLLGQSVNSENQTIPARAIVTTPNNGVLRPGQRINTHIIQVSDRPTFKIPNAAIAQHQGKAFIFIRNPQGFLVSPITVLGKQDDYSIISGEFSGNEDIAVQGAVVLKANWQGLGSDE